MYFVIRHGERGDYAGSEEQKLIQISFDPHLTELGKLQARKAGDKVLKFTQEYYKDSKFKDGEIKYLIISSPFRRCIQTAYHISQALPKESIVGQKIYLNDFLSEHLDDLYFPHHVLKDLQVRTNPDEIKKCVDFELQDGYPNVGDHFSTPEYPEGSKIHKRVADGYDKLKPYFFNEVNKEGNVVLILVSHGYVIECFLQQHKALDYSKGVDYTCLSQYAVDPNSPTEKVLVAQYHEQLKEAEEEYKKNHQHI